MFGVMIALAVVGFFLLFTAPLLARLVKGRAGDPVGLTRVIQLVAVVLLLVALLVRPHSEETAVFKPPPDVADTVDR